MTKSNLKSFPLSIKTSTLLTERINLLIADSDNTMTREEAQTVEINTLLIRAIFQLSSSVSFLYYFCLVLLSLILLLFIYVNL